MQRLSELSELEIVGDVRGTHLMACVEYVRNRDAKEPFPAGVNVGDLIAKHCGELGLVVRPLRPLNVISPPLTITCPQIDELVRISREAILLTQGELRRGGTI